MEKLEALYEREFELLQTLQVLKTPINIYWCWGTSKTINLDNKGLLLKVNGYLHRGWMMITLAWNDTYTVYLLTNKFEVKQKSSDIYFDMLQDTVDKLIETKSN